MSELKINRNIYARQCTIEPLLFEQSQEFIKTFHKQGKVKNNFKILALGLFHEKELVGVIQFSPPRTASKAKKYTCELLRLAFKTDVRVIGGASKLVAYYKKHFKPADIFTYQAMTGEQTDVYAHCGFTLVDQETAGDHVWEWIDPNRTYYTYKITATDSDKYYFGVSHVKKPRATVKDCLEDGYWGSGGKTAQNNKFVNWKKNTRKI